MKRSLLCLLIALLPLMLHAQRDVTAQYITNADLSDGMTGWTVSNFNTPAAAHNAATYASEAYAGWGSLEVTSYSIKQTVTLPKGDYRLVSNSFFRYGLTYDVDASISRCNLVAGSASTPIKTLGSITATGYANSQAQAAGVLDAQMYRTTLDFSVSADDTEVEIGLDGTFDLMRSWAVAGPFRLLDLGQSADEEHPLDVTYLITNPSFEYQDFTGWTQTGTIDMATQTNASFDRTRGYIYAERWHVSGSFGLSQTVGNLPSGKYRLTASTYTSNPSGNTITVNDESQSGITTSQDVTLTSLITDGSLTVSFSGADTGSYWSCLDGIYLTYYGDCVKYYASGYATSAEADTWYSYPVTVAGDYTLSGGTIVYTQDGSQYLSSISATATSGSVISLEAGTLYFKSSSAATIVFSPVSYGYNVGQASIDRTCIQPGQTITVTYPDAVTNDPNMSLSINTRNVTFDGKQISATTADGGFTFTIPTGLALNTTYTLSLPSGTAYYSGTTASSEAQTFSLHTPVVLDGTYFLQNQEGQYLSRGSDWGTRAITDEWGVPVDVATDGEGLTSVSFSDCGHYLYLGSDAQKVWCDNTDASSSSVRWLFTDTPEGIALSFADTPATYIYKNGDDVRLYNGDDSSAGTTQYWTFELPSVHAPKMEALRTAQTALSAKVDGLIRQTILESDITATAEQYQGSGTVVSRTISLVPGIYRFSVPAFHRMTSNEQTQALHTLGADCPPVYVYFGDAKVQIHSVYDYVSQGSVGTDNTYNGQYYPNGQAGALTSFKEGGYVNTIWAEITEPQTIEYGIANQGKIDQTGANKHWTCYASDGFEIVRYCTEEQSLTDYATITVNPYFARGSQDIYGRFTLIGFTDTPAQQGLCYSTTSKQPTVDDDITTDYISYCGSIFHISGLTPSTAYYVRPFAQMTDGTVYYGATHKVYTIKQGSVAYTIRTSDESTYDTNITNAITTWAEYWNRFTTISGYTCSAGYVSGVATADCSYGGWVRFGSNTSYQQCGTAMHENLHGIGMGTTTVWSTLCNGKTWTGPRVNEFIHFWENSESAALYGDSQHAWCTNGSGGLSYTINGAFEDAYSDLQRTANSLLAQSLIEDGLKPTSSANYFTPYYSIEQEDADVFLIRSASTGKYLVETDGTLKAQSYDSAEAASNAGAAWHLIYQPSTQYYHIASVATGDYLSHENYVWGINRSDHNIAIVESVNQDRYWLNTPTSDGRNLLADLSCGTTNLVDYGDDNAQDWIITRVTRLQGDVNNDGLVNFDDVTSLHLYLLGRDNDAVYPDVNQDGHVSIADMSYLVFLLK